MLVTVTVGLPCVFENLPQGELEETYMVWAHIVLSLDPEDADIPGWP